MRRLLLVVSALLLLAVACAPPPGVDDDGDGVLNVADNCPTRPNPGQQDSYGSGAGDACEDSNGNGVIDVAEPHICISVDGVEILRRGTATCDSYEGGNEAVAHGPGARAVAGPGEDNSAVADGADSFAQAGWALCSNNVATARGESSFAFAEGCSNIATAEGPNSAAAAGGGDGGLDNVATAIGPNANASAGPLDDNTALHLNPGGGVGGANAAWASQNSAAAYGACFANAGGTFDGEWLFGDVQTCYGPDYPPPS